MPLSRWIQPQQRRVSEILSLIHLFLNFLFTSIIFLTILKSMDDKGVPNDFVFMTNNNFSRTCEQTPEKLLLYARRKDIRLKQLNPRKQMDSLDMVNKKHS